MSDLMPRLTYEPGAATGLQSVNLTEPGSVTFPPGQSDFPTTTDTFKTLKYEAPAEAIMKTKLAEYHSLMVKITGGTGVQADLDRLKVLMGEIRNYVLTEDDLNLMVDALTKIEEYIYGYLKIDLANKANKLDEVLGLFVETINDFMVSLEAKYANSPENYPIPMKSIYFNKLEQRLQDAITYNEATLSAIVSATQPATPANKAILWFDTNISDAD